MIHFQFRFINEFLRQPYLFLAFLFAFLFLTPMANAQQKIIVIDPGHGGEDLGTVVDYGTTTLAEKDVALALSLETARLLRLKGYAVLLTRDSDQTLTLRERTLKANGAHAHIFVSIHLNSQNHAQGPSPTARGVETYFLNQTTDKTSKRMAQIENEGSLGPQKDPVSLILKDLRLDQNQGASKDLACQIQNALKASVLHPFSRGVKQALFHVLLGADMPSVLVEAGFLSDKQDRQNLLSPQTRSQLAQSLAHGIEAYLTQKKHPPCLVHQ